MKNEKMNTDGINRNTVNRPRPVGSIVGDKTRPNLQQPERRTGRNMDIARSKTVSHFDSVTPKPDVKVQTSQIISRRFDVGPIKHPITKSISDQPQPPQTGTQAPKNPSMQEIKESAIAEATQKMTNDKRDVYKSHKTKSKLAKIIIIALILLISASYLIYINLPNISISVASAQAGVDAKYPEYSPEGFKRSDIVTYSDGQVTIDYIAHSSKNKFSIKQKRSTWDSTAVKDMVNKESNGEFITTEDRGLTIFSYGTNAAWVNGGILYKISGDAELNCDQIQNIANSL